MTSKKKTVDKHFAQRCIQRLGYVPDQKELAKQIREGKLDFVYRESLRVTHWRWIDPVYNVACIIPYDKERKQVITILFEHTYKHQKEERKNVEN